MMFPGQAAGTTGIQSMGTPPAGGGPAGLAAVLGALQAPEQQNIGTPQTTFPDAPRALNPQFIQLILQALMNTQGQAPQGLPPGLGL